MSSAVASVAVAPGRNLSTAPAAGEASSLETLSGQDFAALLLGQTLGGKEGGGEAALGAGNSADTDTAATVSVDPAQLLAEMGLVNGLPPLAKTEGGQGADISRLATANGTSADASLAILTGKNGLDATARPTNRDDNLSPADIARTVLTEGFAVQDSAQSSTTTAKVAGFAEQLTEKLPAIGTDSASASEAPAPQALAAAHSPASAIRAQREALSVATPVRDASWSADFGQKVVWMATQDKQAAQITLNPPQLGPIEISLNVKNDQATAVFASPHAEVREAIESALPRLREMLAGVGIELGQANVNAESFRQAQDNLRDSSREASRNSRGNDGERGTTIAAVGSISGSGTATKMQRGNGLVDTFA